MAIELPADPPRRHMHDLKRRVGPPSPVDERKTGQRDLCVLPREPRENLPTDEPAAGDEAEGVQLRTRRDVDKLALEVKLGLVADHSHLIEPRPFFQLDRRRRVPLNEPRGADECLDDGRARFRGERQLCPGIEGTGGACRGEMKDLDRPPQFGSGRDLEPQHVRRHGLDQRRHRVLGVRRRLETPRDGDAVRRRVAQLGREGAVQCDEPRDPDYPTSGESGSRRLDRRAIRRRRERGGVGHRRTKVGVVPRLDPPGRQPAGFESLERCDAPRRSFPRLQRVELRGQCRFGLRSRRSVSSHRALRPPRRHNRDTRSFRVPARVPDRRSQRCGLWPSHEPRPA